LFTEGILTRRLLTDPTLKGIDAIVLDEFHERHLDSDLALALLKRPQRTRPEIRIVAPNPLAEAAPGILDHMNADHVDSMILLARSYAQMEAAEAIMTSVDRLGFSLRLKTKEGVKGARINFLREVATAQEARKVLIEMVEQTRL
jgi:uncharacterized protein DUF2470